MSRKKTREQAEKQFGPNVVRANVLLALDVIGFEWRMKQTQARERSLGTRPVSPIYDDVVEK